MIKKYSMMVCGSINEPYPDMREEKDGEFYKVEDVKKTVELWEMIKPISFKRLKCQHSTSFSLMCSLFTSTCRCQQCIDIFGKVKE